MTQTAKAQQESLAVRLGVLGQSNVILPLRILTPESEPYKV